MDTVFPSSELPVDCQFKVFISHEPVRIERDSSNRKGQRSLIHFNKAPIPDHKPHQILKRDAKSRMVQDYRVVASGVAMS